MRFSPTRRWERVLSWLRYSISHYASPTQISLWKRWIYTALVANINGTAARWSNVFLLMGGILATSHGEEFRKLHIFTTASSLFYSWYETWVMRTPATQIWNEIERWQYSSLRRLTCSLEHFALSSLPKILNDHGYGLRITPQSFTCAVTLVDPLDFVFQAS